MSNVGSREVNVGIEPACLAASRSSLAYASMLTLVSPARLPPTTSPTLTADPSLEATRAVAFNVEALDRRRRVIVRARLTADVLCSIRAHARRRKFVPRQIGNDEPVERISGGDRLAAP